MRIFIGIDLDPEVRARIERFLAGVEGFVPDARWVRTESLHITLKFIGEQPSAQVDAITERLRRMEGSAFEIQAGGYGFFPTAKAPRVFWIGIHAGPQLAELAERIDIAAAELGVPREDRPYSPHLTLARARAGRTSGSPKWRKGSGPIGATNVARKSPALGVVTLLLDAAKGLAAVLVARVLFSGPHQQLIMTTAAFFAVLGHLFPVWLKFRGGKGVATSLGAFIFLTPKSILCMVVLFLVIAVAFRYVSLGSVVVAAAFPLLAWALLEYVDSRQLIFIALVLGLVIWS